MVDTQEVLPPLLKSNNTPTENSGAYLNLQCFSNIKTHFLGSQIFDILPISLAVDSPEAVPAPVAVITRVQIVYDHRFPNLMSDFLQPHPGESILRQLLIL